MVNICIAVIGSVFLVLAGLIETSSDDVWGPKIAPLALAGIMLVMGSGATLMTMIRKPASTGEASVSDQDPLDSKLDVVPHAKIALVLTLGIFYFYAITLIGYLPSTLIVLFLTLLIFENKNYKKVAAIAVVGAAIYYFAFIQALGIYDPGFGIVDLLGGKS